MRLLVFAHRGEAQSFLKYFDFTPVPNEQDFYSNTDLSLLITGEGPTQSIYSLSSALSLKKEIKQVINLGIAGALSEKIQINEIIEIDLCYLENEFKSFKLEHIPLPEITVVDCITANTRVTTKVKANSLLPMAPVVDRELWAQAFVCKQKHIPLSSFKLISDQITQAESCQTIRDEATDFSDKLLQFYLKNLNNFESDTHHEFQTNFEIFNDKTFYFTISHKREFSKTMSLLRSRLKVNDAEIFKKVQFDIIKELEILPKMRTKNLIEKLEELLYPVKYSIKQKLKDISAPFDKNGFQLKFDENLEDNYFQLQAKISGPEDFEKLKKSMSQFSFEELGLLQSGEAIFKDTES